VCSSDLERLLQTGDLGYYLPDGNIVFCGRMDTQVTLDDFSFNLYEVESILLMHTDVQDVAVCVQEDNHGEKYLCAFVVGDGQDLITELKQLVEQKLPSQMLPTSYEQVKQLPLDRNGKLNRNLLERKKEIPPKKSHTPPVTEEEKKLVVVWQQVLAMEKIGTTDKFFELGGDILHAIRIVSILQGQGYQLDLSLFTRSITIQELAPKLLRWVENPEILVTGQAPVTIAQKAFLDENIQAVHASCQSRLMLCHDKIKIKDLYDAITRLVEYHDALRLIFHFVDDQWHQINQAMQDDLFQIVSIDLRQVQDVRATIVKWANQMKANLHITKGPLMRIAHFQTDQGDYLLWVIHELLIDEVSWCILMDDFLHIYRQVTEQEDIFLLNKSTSYLDWAKQYELHAQNYLIENEDAYWDHFANIQVPALPIDQDGNKNFLDKGMVSFRLSHQKTEKLVNQIHLSGLHGTLITALSMALKNWGDIHVFALMLTNHGRGSLAKERFALHRTIGRFAYSYPVVIDSKGLDARESYIDNVKQSLLLVPNDGFGYGLWKYQSIQSKNEVNQPRIRFRYNGNLDTWKIDGEWELVTDSDFLDLHDGTCGSYTFDIQTFILHQQLVVNVRYGKTTYREETMRAFLRHYKKYLENLIDHCLCEMENL
jgi:non-ribosomal peptide synthase protein (TIGR01720 family)